MELRHIRYFLVVAECLNFTKAAEKLCIAQPPLSRQIRDLEEELGTPLFERKSRGLQLTEAGRQYRQYAVQIVNLADQSAQVIRNMEKGLQGTLYLASVEGQAPRLLSRWIAGFHKLYPRVEYSLWNGNSDDIADRTMRGLCDLAILTEPYNGEGFSGFPVWEEPWIVMIPPDHPLAGHSGHTITPAELAPYDLIIPSRHSREGEIGHWFEGTGQKPHIIGKMAHMLNAFELAEQGVGICIYPAAAAYYAQNSNIIIKELREPAVTAVYVLVYSSQRPLSLVASAFLEYVRQHPAPVPLHESSGGASAPALQPR